MSGTPSPDVRKALFLAANSRVSTLQERVRGDDPSTVATLARLRRCDPAEAGAEPLVWEVTLGNLPDALTHLGDERSEGLTPAERALHATLVLYALHQQSKDEGVHRPGIRFGQAVGALARSRAVDEDLDNATVSRLHQAALAGSFNGHVYYLRGLIQLMRAETPTIGLDYARLAVDLWQLADSHRDSKQVIAAWGRDLHHRPKSTDPANPTSEETK